MPNAIAQLMLVLWPVISVWLFVKLPIGRALIASLILGYLFLPPPPAGFDFPLLPPLTKETIPSLVAVFACLLLYRDQIQILPRNPLARVLLAVFVLSPIGTVLTNGDPIYVGDTFIPGLRLREGIAQGINQLLLISPMVLAQGVLRSNDDLRDVIWALFLAGLAYSLPMLVEIRLSPQLNIWIYGYFQHSFEQMIRFGGFRPIVFLYHGLWAAFLMMTAVLAALTIAKADVTRRAVLWWLLAGYLLVVLILCKSVASLLYGVAFAPVVILLSTRMQISIAMIFAVMVMVYPVLKTTNLVPEERLLAAAEEIDEERAGSLRFRLVNENILMAHANERPLFGWGSWGRNQLYDEVTGEITTTTDGRWIITIGVYGWLGFFAEFGLLTLPIFLLGWRTFGVIEKIPPWLGGAAIILAINLFDLLPNATLTPMTWLMVGALLGYSEQAQFKRRRKAAPLQTVL